MLGNIGLLGVMVSLLVCFQSAGDGVHNSGLVALLWNVLRVRNSEASGWNASKAVCAHGT